jgi:hypothetical protein
MDNAWAFYHRQREAIRFATTYVQTAALNSARKRRQCCSSLFILSEQFIDDLVKYASDPVFLKNKSHAAGAASDICWITRRHVYGEDIAGDANMESKR